MKSRRLLLVTHVACWLPLAALAWDFTQGRLSVNPIQDITLRTGKFALLFLVLSLACTPVNTVFGFKQVIPLRKWLGLYAFLYASLHFLTFAVLDYGLDWSLIQQAIVEKRYVLAGFAALLILVPLALTSTKGWMRRLGKAWKRLHRFAYLAGALVILHYVWLVKTDVREPALWGIVLMVLFILRIPRVKSAVVAARLRFRSRFDTQPANLS